MLPNRTESLKLLLVSPLDEDHASLQAIIKNSTWKLLKVRQPSEALSAARKCDIPVVMCERELAGQNWVELFERIQDLPQPQSTISHL